MRFTDKKLVLFSLLVAFCSIAGHSQTRNNPLSKSGDKEVLEYYENKAKDFTSKNMYRLAVDRLQAYDFMLDSLYREEKRDTLATIEKNYRTGSASLITGNQNQKKKITQLNAEKDKLNKQYWSLAKKAVLSFVFWLLIVLFLLQFRKRKLKKAESRLEAALTQLQSLENDSAKAEALFSHLSPLKDSFGKIVSESAKLNQVVSSGNTNAGVPSEWKDISTKAEKLKKVIESEDRVVNAVLSQAEPAGDEKAGADINILCEQYLEMAYRGSQGTEAFNCQISRDFEKNLPALKINSSAVGSLLLDVLNNAFQSVKEKNGRGIKGYQPKVAVSTRILPRFVQVRVKDNGMGIKEENVSKATDEFFSTRLLGEGAGIGLYSAKTIISEMHKGEIKIESEEGNSTDVYIKFFTEGR